MTRPSRARAGQESLFRSEPPNNKLNAIRVLVADHQPIFRQGLRTLLERECDLRVVGEASDGPTVVRLARRLATDILLLDLAMPVLPGLEVLRQVAKSSARTRTILLVTGIESVVLLEAVKLGARGVIFRDTTAALFIKAIRSVMAGQYWLGREKVFDLVQRLGAPGVLSAANELQNNLNLSPRELQIASAIVEGARNKEIAQKLSLSEDTIKHHLTNIFDKVGVSTRLELAMFLIHHDVLDGYGTGEGVEHLTSNSTVEKVKS